jgi:DNA primase
MTTTMHPPARWGYTLVDLFEQAGNSVHVRSNGDADCGHEPFHASRSGSCVWIRPEDGFWWCRSCRRSGDTIDFVRDLNGWGYHRACVWLRERFGPPDGPRVVRSVR